MKPTNDWYEEQEGLSQKEDLAFEDWLGDVNTVAVVDWCAHTADVSARLILEWYLDDYLQGKLLPPEINDLFGKILQDMFKEETSYDD